MQAVVLEGQLRALQAELALGGFERAGHVDTADDLAAQLRPELSQACELDVDLAGQLLLQAAAAVDAVIPQANIQRAELPLLASAAGLGLEHRGLATQFALEVQVRVEIEAIVLHHPFAAQRPGQGPGQFAKPIRRVDGRQLQRRVPGNALGKLQAQVPFGLACPAASLSCGKWICVRSPLNGLPRLKAPAGPSSAAWKLPRYWPSV